MLYPSLSPTLLYPPSSFPTMPPTPTCAILPAPCFLSVAPQGGPVAPSRLTWSSLGYTQVTKNRRLQATTISPSPPSVPLCAFHSRSVNILSPRRGNIDILFHPTRRKMMCLVFHLLCRNLVASPSCLFFFSFFFNLPICVYLEVGNVNRDRTDKCAQRQANKLTQPWAESLTQL